MRKPDEPELRWLSCKHCGLCSHYQPQLSQLWHCTLCGRKTKVPTQGEKTRLARMLRAAAVRPAIRERTSRDAFGLP